MLARRRPVVAVVVALPRLSLLPPLRLLPLRLLLQKRLPPKKQRLNKIPLNLYMKPASFKPMRAFLVDISDSPSPNRAGNSSFLYKKCKRAFFGKYRTAKFGYFSVILHPKSKKRTAWR
jgi:hypothetical protein